MNAQTESHAAVDLSDWRSNQAEAIQVLRDSFYPGASDASIVMVLRYCEAAKLDPMLKPVHLVPMSIKTGAKKNDRDVYETRDVVMPGVGLYRTNAARTNAYAGMSEPEFGPIQTLKYTRQVWYNKDGGGRACRDVVGEMQYPLWCKIVAKRIVQGVVCEFPAVEYWTENYATAGRDSDAPNAMWLRRPYGQIAKCFDSETEVLTSHGFQRFSEVTGAVMQVLDGGMSASTSVPFCQDYDGEMIVADGTRLNFSVTPNHDMVTTSGKIEAGALYDAATMAGNKFLIPRAPMPRAEEASVSDAILSLVGFFLADGSHTGYRQFRIAVSRPYKIESLRSLGLHQSEVAKLDAGRIAHTAGRDIVTIHDKSQFVYDFSLIEEFVDAEKSLNIDWLLTLSSRQARILVDALLEFDGSENGNGVRRFHQKNEAVIRGFEIAAVQAGYSVGPRVARKTDIGSAFCITVSEAAAFSVVRGVKNNSASLVKRKNSSGTVWCVAVPSGVIVVRRHGFSMLCGNCAEAQALRKGFPEAVGSQPTAEEMEGRTIILDPEEVQTVSANLMPQSKEMAAPKSDPVLETVIETKVATPETVAAKAETVAAKPETKSAEPETAKPEKTGGVPISESMLRVIRKKASVNNVDEAALCGHFGIAKLEDLAGSDAINKAMKIAGGQA